MHNREKATRSTAPAPFVFLMHCAIGLVLSTILSLISAMLISAESLPADLIDTVSSICVFLGVAVASAISARKFGRIMFSALLQGLIFFAALYLFGAVFFARFIPMDPPVAVFLSCLIGSVSGGILAACGKKRRR